MRYNFSVKKVGIMKISVGVSNRHCHLTKEVYEKLFGKSELTFKRALNQPGQFAAEETVIIKGPKGSIEKVRVLGPFRSYNQVEVSKTDAYKLGINPPVRKSGHLDGASELEIIDCAVTADAGLPLFTRERAGAAGSFGVSAAA